MGLFGFEAGVVVVAIGNQYDAGQPPDQDFLARKAAVTVHHDGEAPAPLGRDADAVRVAINHQLHNGWRHPIRLACPLSFVGPPLGLHRERSAFGVAAIISLETFSDGHLPRM